MNRFSIIFFCRHLALPCPALPCCPAALLPCCPALPCPSYCLPPAVFAPFRAQLLCGRCQITLFFQDIFRLLLLEKYVFLSHVLTTTICTALGVKHKVNLRSKHSIAKIKHSWAINIPLNARTKLNQPQRHFLGLDCGQPGGKDYLHALT
jgi:hypothetical protein